MKTGFLGTPVVRQPLVNPGQQPTETKEQQEQLQQQGGRVALADEPAYEPAVTQEAEVLEAAVKQTSGAKGGPAISDPEAWARNFEQCLALLRGPSDEQR